MATLNSEVQCHIQWLLAAPFMQGPNASGRIKGEEHRGHPDTWLEVIKQDGVVSLAAYAYNHNDYESEKLPNKDFVFKSSSLVPIELTAFKPREYLGNYSVAKGTEKEILSFSLNSLLHTCHLAWLNNDSERFSRAFDALTTHVPWLKDIQQINARAHAENNRSTQWEIYHLGLALHQSNIFEQLRDDNYVTTKLDQSFQKAFTLLNLQSNLAYLFTTRPIDTPLLYALKDDKSQKTTGYLLKILVEPEMDELRPLYAHHWLDCDGALMFFVEDGSNEKFRGKRRCLASSPPTETLPNANNLPLHHLTCATLVLQSPTEELDLVERWATSERATAYQVAWSNGNRSSCAVPLATWAIRTWSRAEPKDAQVLEMLLPKLAEQDNDRSSVDNAPLIGQWRTAIGLTIAGNAGFDSLTLPDVGLDPV